jgi:RNase H-fold protein (predicted Holliday junction resolvase)
MKLALGQIKDKKRLLGLDIGQSSTGVAVSDFMLQKSYVSQFWTSIVAENN